MTLTELRYIVAVAQHQHFGRAADACHVSQPTLSLGIKKLEEELEVELFERGVRNELRITPVGERIIEQAQRVLEQASVIKQLASNRNDPLAGQLRLGAIYTIAPYLLPQLIPRIHRRAPDMPLLIEENFTAVLSEQLKQGKVDVIIIALPFAEQGIVTQAVYDEPFMVATPKDHPWASRKNIEAAELAEQSLLLLGPGHCFRDQVLQTCPMCQTSGSLQQGLAGTSLETIRHMVATGAGITVLPSSSGRGTNNSLLSLIPFKRPAPTRRVALAWRKSFTRPEAVEALRQEILKCKLNDVVMLENESIRD
ncbi:MAG: hydrogen peroxide-inducible genes activator [Gammaproteobacteria bacterium]|jgi:LysR family transcriptional regulator, hydrogen peroxide-inducible genes activator|nr:hydrogen peroxide-inducible genes activator [Gammaproteobacteria bacterium]